MRPAAGLLVTLIVVSLSGGQGSATPVEPEIAYTDFKALVEQGKVEEIVLQGGEMAGKLRAPVPLGPHGEPAARFRTRIPGFGDADQRHFSESSAQTVDRAVQGLLIEAEGRARQVVHSHRELLVRLVARLEEDETLEREQIESCLGPRPLAIALEAAG